MFGKRASTTVVTAATPSAYPKPAHPAPISNAGMRVAPKPVATSGAQGGVSRKWVLVAMITPNAAGTGSNNPLFDLAVASGARTAGEGRLVKGAELRQAARLAQAAKEGGSGSL